MNHIQANWLAIHIQNYENAKLSKNRILELTEKIKIDSYCASKGIENPIAQESESVEPTKEIVRSSESREVAIRATKATEKVSTGEAVCVNCQNSFEAKTARSKYCSTKCKSEFFRKNE